MKELITFVFYYFETGFAAKYKSPNEEYNQNLKMLHVDFQLIPLDRIT